MNHYQHSGRAPLGGALASLVQCALVAAGAGILYTLLAHYLLFIIVLIALPPALGFLLSEWVGHSAFRSKIRNVWVVRLLAFAAGAIALYAAWGTTFYGMVKWEDLSAALRDLKWQPYLPQNILGIGQHLFAKGFFVVKEGEEPLRGWLLATLWSIEAALIVGIPVFFAEHVISKQVFCERCDQWIPSRIINRLLASGLEPVWDRVAAGEWDALDELPRAEPGMRPVVELWLQSCQTCEESFYLSATAIRAAANGNAEEKKLLDRLEIPAAAVEQVASSGYEISDDAETDEEDFEGEHDQEARPEEL